MKKTTSVLAVVLLMIVLVSCNFSSQFDEDKNSSVPTATSSISESSQLSVSSSEVISSTPSKTSFSSSKKSSSTSSKTKKPSNVTDPNDPNFDPYNKPGYVYVPGEGYLKIEEGQEPEVEEAMGGESFWDTLNDPDNKKVGE